jgi:hypothetical protein
VGLFSRDVEVPSWIHGWDYVNGVFFLWAPMVIAGMVCLAIGNTAGRIIGAVLLCGGLLWAFVAIRRLRSR